MNEEFAGVGVRRHGRQGIDVGGVVSGAGVAGWPPAEVGRVEDSTGPRVMTMDGQTTPATILLYIPPTSSLPTAAEA